LADGVWFSRSADDDATLGARLLDQLAGRHKKLAALRYHRAEGKRTLTLLQSNDMALMDPVKLLVALEGVFPTRPEKPVRRRCPPSSRSRSQGEQSRRFDASIYGLLRDS